ncbi:hypothetical protein JCM10207_004815 [Rhodosporidiobolus poonsookiae]
MPRPPQLYNGLSLALQASGILASAAYNPVRVELERLARTLPRHPQIVDLFTRLVRDSFGFVDANGDDSAAPAPSREDIVQFLEERFPDALLGWGDEEAFFSADADSPGMERIPLNLQLCQALVRDPNQVWRPSTPPRPETCWTCLLQVGFARTNCLRFLFWVAMVHAVARTMYRHFLRIHTQTRAAKCSLDGDSPGWAAERQLFGGILGVEWREEDVDDFERVDQWLWTPDGTTDTPLAISGACSLAFLLSRPPASGSPRQAL